MRRVLAASSLHSAERGQPKVPRTKNVGRPEPLRALLMQRFGQSFCSARICHDFLTSGNAVGAVAACPRWHRFGGSNILALEPYAFVPGRSSEAEHHQQAPPSQHEPSPAVILGAAPDG